MELVRIRRLSTARVVARRLRRYNGVNVRAERLVSKPHYLIRERGHLAGWIGYERCGRRSYEIVHMTVLPRFRRRGFAEEATIEILEKLRLIRARRAYVRIRRGNRVPMHIISQLGFRRTSRGKINIFRLNLARWAKAREAERRSEPIGGDPMPATDSRPPLAETSPPSPDSDSHTVAAQLPIPDTH
jgi:GNAT superfamily N-acetyltransferase